MTETPAVLMHEVSFAYTDTLVLEDVNVVVPEGEFLGVVGPNGGGKTTFLKLILGLLQPTRGQIEVFGRAPAAARSLCGYVPQSFQYDPTLPVTVLDVVLMGRLGHGAAVGPYGREDRRAGELALERVGLGGMGHQLFADLSGGQQQRALIARALAADPRMLLLDEPTANVDAAVEADIYRLLGELNATMTIIMVTHDLGFVSSYVQNVLCINRRVRRHPTMELATVTGDVLRQTLGGGLRIVRHDKTSPPRPQ